MDCSNPECYGRLDMLKGKMLRNSAGELEFAYPCFICYKLHWADGQIAIDRDSGCYLYLIGDEIRFGEMAV